MIDLNIQKVLSILSKNKDNCVVSQFFHLVYCAYPCTAALNIVFTDGFPLLVRTMFLLIIPPRASRSILKQIIQMLIYILLISYEPSGQSEELSYPHVHISAVIFIRTLIASTAPSSISPSAPVHSSTSFASPTTSATFST